MPFTKSIKALSFLVQEALCQPINHCLLNLYRDGSDFIPFHSDNVLDIKRSSVIATLSLGAPRSYTLKKNKNGADTMSH